MRSYRLTISLALVLLPGFALAIRVFDGWAVPVRRDHDQVFHREVRDVKSLFSRVNSNQRVEFPFRGTDSDGAVPKANTDVSNAFKAIKGSRTVTRVTDKGNKTDKRSKSDKEGKTQKCKKDKKDKNNSGGGGGCEEVSVSQTAQPQPQPTPVPTDAIARFDVEPIDSVADSQGAPAWTYAPAWSPSWPFWSPTSTDAPVVPGRFAPVSAPATAPVTATPVTTAPVTTAPVTTAPVTTAPVITAPVITAPVTAPVTAAPVVSSTNAPVSSQNLDGAMTRLTKAPVTYAPATAAPATPSPVVQYAFHFPDDMVHHTEAPVTAALVTAAPITAVLVDPPTSANTGGVLHPAVVEEVEADGTLLYKLQLETDTLVVQFGGPDLDISALQAIMYEKMDTLLEQHYITHIGTIFDSFDLSLNFSEEIINDATEDENVTTTDGEATTAVIGSVEVATTINLLTKNRNLLMAFDETFVTNILRSFFDSEYLQELLNELDNQMLELSFLELETSDGTITEAIATHNVGESNTSAGSTALIAGALAGVMVFVTGAALFARRGTSNDDADSHGFDSDGDDDQLHPLSGEKAASIGFPSAEDIDDEDSMGSDSFLDWARPDTGSPSRIPSGSIRDEDGDLFPVNL